MRVPGATYRVQFNPSFGFKEAKKIIAFLDGLGITDLYASPVFRAVRGSTHGYDIVDTTILNPDLGEEKDFFDLAGELKDKGMGWIQDVVPNHMAFHGENQMLMDVLEKGEDSKFYGFFDIEWDHPYEGIKGRLLAPFLGKFYGEALESGEIRLSYVDTGLSINYYDLKLPLSIASYAGVFTHELKRLEDSLAKDHPDYIKFLGIIYVLKNLSSAQSDELYDQVRFVKRMLRELYSGSDKIKRFVDGNIEVFNGTAGEPESFNLLDRLLSEQHYRLAFWKVATEEISYRRFFNINSLISLRVEDEEVFNYTHGFLSELIEKGCVTGLRVDHIDGLSEPENYLVRLRKKAEDLFIVVEKILCRGETLSNTWPVQGTTGYEFLNNLNGLFCFKGSGSRFTRIYTNFTKLRRPYEDLVYEKKKLIIEKDMNSDVNNLAYFLNITLSKDRYGGDITMLGLRRAVREVLANLPVYRTYVCGASISERDRAYIREAVRKSIERAPALLYELKFIERVLTLEFKDYLTEDDKKEWLNLVMRFQQFTGPLMAKGFEDTLLYVYSRLLSLNEVGGSPDRFGVSTDEFHAFNIERAEEWPHSLNATSTHDTKRGEDVRARINVLSEIPEEWEAWLKKWSRINRKRKVNGVYVPDRNDEYFLYQTLLGAWPFYEEEQPLFVDRIRDYVIKVIREAKVHTGWLEPDTKYEDAFIAFVENILERSPENRFLAEFVAFQRKVAWYGVFNSLSQTVVKITSPGVPDFYQGSELWDLNLVDPDNRRPVDFNKRILLLKEISKRSGSEVLDLAIELLETYEDGRIKLFLIYMGLRARRENQELFKNGSYVPLEVKGAYKDNLTAFARVHGKTMSITVAPRFFTTLVNEGEYPLGKKVWGDTVIVLPGDASRFSWKNAITDRSLKAGKTLGAAEVLEHFPVAMLISEENR